MTGCEESKFLESYIHEDTSFCDRIINTWTLRNKQAGSLKVNSVVTVDKEKKDSLDVVVDCNDPELDEYFIKLQQCVDRYIEKYNYCNTHAPWSVVEGVNIQYYPPGGGYKIWHAERGTGSYPNSGRHLVFMTYLNTVEGDEYEGGTEWLYQNKKVKAVKGKTVIWPADWTFTHRGIESVCYEKYVITGWFNFIK